MLVARVETDHECSSMTRAWYHIVVIGSDLPGLVFAALAARRGYRVCVIGQGGEPSRYRHEGHWFLQRREVFCGAGSAPAISRVFSELALGLELKNRPQPIEPSLQIAMPGARLDVSRDARVLLRELEREFPGQVDGLEHLDLDARAAAAALDPLTVGDLSLPPHGFRERARFRDQLRALDPHLLDPHDEPFAARFAHPGMRQAAHAIVDALADLGTEHLPRHLALRLWRAFRDGLHRFPGGEGGLEAMFVRKLRDQSGDFRPDAFATRLDLRRTRVAAVGLAERGEAIGCELLVLNAAPDKVGPLLGVVAEPARAHRVFVNIALDPRVIPTCMGPELLLLHDPTAPSRPAGFGSDGPSAGVAWWVSRPGIGPYSDDPSRPGPGVIQMSAISRGHRLPALLEEPSFLRHAALTALRTVVPWLDDGLRAVHLPPPIPLVTAMDPAAAHLAPSPWARFPVSNALATSAGPATPLGLEGACIQALGALHDLTRRLRLKGGLPHARS